VKSHRSMMLKISLPHLLDLKMEQHLSLKSVGFFTIVPLVRICRCGFTEQRLDVTGQSVSFCGLTLRQKNIKKTLTNFPEGLEEAHAQECIEFAQAILDGAPSPVPPEQSLQVMQILEGIYRSQDAGSEIEIQ
jgi:hypothetical protein